MADFNSSLPVRTQTAGDVSVKIDQTTPGTTNAVQVIGGVIPGVTASSLGKTEGSAQASGDVGVSALFRCDTAPDATTGIVDGDYANPTVDANGRAWIVGSAIDGGAFTAGSTKAVVIAAVRNDSIDALADDKVGPVRCDTNRAVFVNIRDAAGNDRGLNIDSSGRLAVTGNFGDAVSSGDVCEYDTITDLAAATESTTELSYTVVSSFLLKQVIVGASGKVRITVKTGPTASLVTKAVIYTSTANPNGVVTFAQPIEVLSTSTGIVRILVKNLEATAQDVHCTILGNEV